MAKAPDRVSRGGPSPQDKAKICKLAADLISEGENPPVMLGSKMWDPRKLAKWYGMCGLLSGMLSTALGDSNSWKTVLTSWDPTKGDDPAFHDAMLGTLDSIKETMERR